MTHALARRCRHACDKANDWLFHFARRIEFSRLFLSRSPNFTNHDDALGFIVCQEQIQRIDKVGAVHRVTTDTNTGRLAQTGRRGLCHSLIGQGARATDDTDFTALMNVARHDADFALTRGDHARAVRPDQAGFATGQRTLDAHHVQDGNALRNAHGQFDFGVNRLQNRVGSEWWRHVNCAGVGASGFLGLCNRVEHRAIQVRGAALAWADPTNDVGAIGNGLLAMERALLTGETLGDDLGVFVNQNCHCLTLPSQQPRPSQPRLQDCRR